MATYSALTTITNGFSVILHYCDANLSLKVRNSFEFILKEFKSFKNFVEGLDSRSRKRMSGLLVKVTQESLQLIDYMCHDKTKDLDQLLEKTHSLIETMKKIKEECCSLLEDDEEAASSSSSSSKMVGLCDELTLLKENFMDGLDVQPACFFIHGMAGIGKTVLAREFFEDLDVSEWFECRVWVRVGLERKPEEFLGVILAQLNPDAHQKVMGGDEEEEAQRLSELLKNKRCLIVLDDVWDIQKHEQSWFRFLAAINSKNGSRVVVTTRIFDYDFHNAKSKSMMAWPWFLVRKRLLNDEESWDLLREKAFGGGWCPPQLEDDGKKIARKCYGLPLMIITVASLLSKAGDSLWIEVATKRKHQLFIDAYDQILKVLYPSYKELRDELKLCFLYMGVFPPMHAIRRTMLINLWTVEEIFDPTVKRSELYYHDLESLKYLDLCSLIMVDEKSSTYFNEPPIQAIKTCGLHPSWWHFCQREASKINFFHVLDCPKDGLEEGIKGQSRLSIHNNVLFAWKDVYNSMEENCSSTAQSLLCFGPYHQYQVPMCFGLKLLQRLDALTIRFYDFPLEIIELVKLKYLALTCNGDLPPSISKLGRLQYLIVHPHLSIKRRGTLSCMPMEIWDLEELKYLQVVGSDLPASGDNSLRMLLTLLDVSMGSCTVLNRFPNLKKLKIRIELTPDEADPLFFSNQISNQINLESLKCIVMNPGCMFPVVPPISSFPILPSSLKKLSLSGLRFPWEEMREIALLPSLQQLKLRCNAFQGQNWEVEESEFPSLYFLLIEDIDLVNMKGPHGSFRSLKHLSIKHCYKLEEIQLRNFDKVSNIEIVNSNPLVEKNIKRSIQEGCELPGTLISVHYSWKSARAPWFRRGAV